jgi:hypothetical protein
MLSLFAALAAARSDEALRAIYVDLAAEVLRKAGVCGRETS